MFAFARRAHGPGGRGARALGDDDGLDSQDDREVTKSGVVLYGMSRDEEAGMSVANNSRVSSGCGTVEFSCGGGSNAVPRSVAICKTTSDLEGAGMEVRLPTPEESPSSGRAGRLRMGPMRLLYVPRLFRPKSKEVEESEEAGGGELVTWNEIREEGQGSPCSSGVAPASAPSPHMSPFTIRGLFSPPTTGRWRRKKPSNEEEARQEEEDDLDADMVRAESEEADEEEEEEERNGTRSPVREIAFQKAEAASPNDDAFFHSVEIEKCGTGQQRRNTTVKSTIDGRNFKNETPRASSPTSSSSSDGSRSTIEWGIDVPPARASTFESNMSELKNLLVSIKDIGSRADSHPHEEIFAQRSVEFESSTLGGADPSPPELGLAYTESGDGSDESTFPGANMDIEPVESDEDGHGEDGSRAAISRGGGSRKSSRSGQSGGRRPPPPRRGRGRRGITFSEELLSGDGSRPPSGAGGPGFTFRSIFEDPKNALYECRAPSGPLGIVVDGTPLGPRVRSLNPLSPIFGKISPGDVIVGVDETDTVGLDAGGFWRVVSRKASQQERVLAVLRI